MDGRWTLAMVVVSLLAAPAAAQEPRRALLYGTAGGAKIGHAESEQGTAAIFGGGATFLLARRLAVDADVHAARVSGVFGRDDHHFTQATITASLLYLAPVHERGRLLMGGGVGLQRSRSEFTLDPHGRLERTAATHLWHGRIGVEWDVAERLALRTEGVLWMGGGLDWIAGARAALGYRF